MRIFHKGKIMKKDDSYGGLPVWKQPNRMKESDKSCVIEETLL